MTSKPPAPSDRDIWRALRPLQAEVPQARIGLFRLVRTKVGLGFPLSDIQRQEALDLIDELAVGFIGYFFFREGACGSLIRRWENAFAA